MIRAAIYCRKSDDDTGKDVEARSVERQRDAALRYAAEQGWTVDPAHEFVDQSVSGAEWKHRAGWNALLATLEPQPLFTRLIVSELSRIGRDSVRTPQAVLTLEEAGIEIHSYLNRSRITLSDESGEMSTLLQSLLASFERRRASDRTRDALRRRAEAGAVTGGAAYGFHIVRNGEPYSHYAINPVEAAIVTEVFNAYDRGDGLGKIAKALNARGVPGPRGGAWSTGAIRLMLARELYIGRLTWNRRRNTMKRGTRGRQQASPSGEWVKADRPELAIVDPPLFARLQQGIAERGAAFLRNQEGHLLGRPRFADAETSYLLTGLLRCALCGAALGPVCPGRSAGRQAWYTCGGYHRKGPRAGCRNGLRIEVGALNAAVLDAVAKALDADTVRQAVREAVGLLSANQADIEVRRAALTAELGTLQGRERRILDSLMDAEGDVATAIKGQLRSS